jgi:hypothetical protein
MLIWGATNANAYSWGLKVGDKAGLTLVQVWYENWPCFDLLVSVLLCEIKKELDYRMMTFFCRIELHWI